jgi:general secretion pathway protein L
MADRPLTIDLRAPVQLADVPSLAGGFVAWWRDELVSLWPGRKATPRAGEDLFLFPRGERWFLKTPDRIEPVSLDTRLDDAALADRMFDAARGAPLSGLKVVLPREHVLLRRLELPVMSPVRLRQAVELQIDRISPFKADAVRYAHRVAGRDPERHLAAVDVAIVPHARLQPVEARLRGLGLVPAGIDVEAEGGVAEGFDLREPPSVDDVRRKRNRNLFLGAAAVCIWVLAFYAWSDAGAREESAWQEQIDQLRPAAERSAALRRQVQGLAGPIAAANARDPAAMLEVLSELTRVVPDSVRVLELKIEGGSVRIAGLADSAPALVGVLEQSALFADVKAVSAFVRRPDSGKDRFDIAMRLETVAP